MKKINVLNYLSRTDKWYLGGGNKLLWAPPFPVHLDYPGFWDEAHYYNYELKPLFTWAILDDDGNEIQLKFKSRTWNPAALTQTYDVSIGNAKIEIIETKSILPSDIASCTIELHNKSRRSFSLHLIAWTVQEHFPSKESNWIDGIDYINGVISFNKYLRPSVMPHLQFACAFGFNQKARSHSINLSDRTAIQPHWKLTPFYESFQQGKLPNEVRLSGSSDEGIIYLGLHQEIKLKANKSESIAIMFATASTVDEALQNLKPVIKSPDPSALSKMSWDDHFQHVPYFQCSDEFLTRYYWYRWYGLRLNTIYGNEGNYKRPCVCEGIQYFRAPISYSAQCHMLENRWMHEPELAQGSLFTFLDNQRDDGGFRGYIDVNHYRQEMFYHANWGNAVMQLQAIHPSFEYLENIYGGLKKYVSYFDRERDEEVSGLYDIDNHFETGQEFMSRYMAVSAKADQKHWGEVFRLKGVDVTIYIYDLKRALAVIAEKLAKQEEADLWKFEADKIKTAVREKMWDPEQQMFFDVNPMTAKRTMIKAVTCFYPYFTDIVDESHLIGLKKHLLNPKEFWTPYPVPSSSADDEFFSALPEWKGKRMNCLWNGRVWPMTNSHIAEALAQSAIRFDDQLLRKKSMEFIGKFIKMMFFDGDPTRPNCFEHYNPLTGKPSAYRGIDDYQHSWINDLIIKYVCGIRPEEFSVTIDPFPFGLQYLMIENVLIRERMLRVEIHNKSFKVWVDGEHNAESVIGKPIAIQL
ncbi:MAG: hypothetical protein HY089_08450 [Ignavibacteriales bacterium]|nr:hypothetical protein [Ignavibacteriales bacterium]